jgi:hypothetical protein
MVLAASEDKTHRGAYVGVPVDAVDLGQGRPVRAVPPRLVARPRPDRDRADRGRRRARRQPGFVLAHQLRRTDADTWSHVKRAADFLLGFEQDGNRAPWSPQDRWENQSGYSPATIASEIAGLVCAAAIARANGDEASAGRYLATADEWQARVKDWTVTTTGPYSDGPYFLRLTKDGNPNTGTTYTISHSGPSNVDQRAVVEPS